MQNPESKIMATNETISFIDPWELPAEVLERDWIKTVDSETGEVIGYGLAKNYPKGVRMMVSYSL